jgi:hypothetical protein
MKEDAETIQRIERHTQASWLVKPIRNCDMDLTDLERKGTSPVTIVTRRNICIFRSVGFNLAPVWY